MHSKSFAFGLPIEFFFDLPEQYFVFWKNQNSVFLGGNDVVAERIGIQTSELAGKTDFDFIFDKEAGALQRDDQIVMRANQPRAFREKVCFKNSTSDCSFLAFKAPLLNSANHQKGIFGISFELKQNAHQKTKTAIRHIQKAFLDTSRNFIGLNFEILTPREKECLYYLIRGKTAKETGLILCRSQRTIEDHINNLKKKFNCRTRSELIEKVFTECLLY